MRREEGRESPTLTDALEAPLDELLDPAGAATLSRSFFGLFRIPIRVFAEGGQAIVRSGDEPELHRMLAQNADSSQHLGHLYTQLKQLDLGSSGERTHRSFTGASYHVVAIGHGGKRVGRAVLGPFVQGELSIESFRRALGNRIDEPQLQELAANLPRAKQDTVRSIGRHLVITLGLVLHESHRALLSARMHLASMRETQREALRQKHLVQLAQERALVVAQTRSGVVNEVGRAMHRQLRAVSESSSPSAHNGGMGRKPMDSAIQLCTGLIELSALDCGDFRLNREACVAEQLIRVIGLEFKRREMPVSLEQDDNLPSVSLDCEALVGCLGQLAARVFPASKTDCSLLIEYRKVAMESTESSVGALMFLAAPASAEVQLRLWFTVSAQGVPAGISEALGPNALPSARGNELQVTLARRIVEAHGGRLSVTQVGPDRGHFTVVLPG